MEKNINEFKLQLDAFKIVNFKMNKNKEGEVNFESNKLLIEDIKDFFDII